MFCKTCQKKIKRYSKKHYQEYGNYCIECDQSAEVAGKRECDTGEIDFENLIWRTILTCWHTTRNQVRIIDLLEIKKQKKLRRVDVSNKN